MRPQTAKELWTVLTDIFPGFSVHCEDEDIQPDTTLHFVMSDFTTYFGRNRDTFSESQLRKLAQFKSFQSADAVTPCETRLRFERSNS